MFNNYLLLSNSPTHLAPFLPSRKNYLLTLRWTYLILTSERLFAFTWYGSSYRQSLLIPEPLAEGCSVGHILIFLLLIFIHCLSLGVFYSSPLATAEAIIKELPTLPRRLPNFSWWRGFLLLSRLLETRVFNYIDPSPFSGILTYTMLRRYHLRTPRDFGAWAIFSSSTLIYIG